MAKELRIHSDEAWNIASRYRHILASETRDLAAAIDVALQKARAEEVDRLRSGRVKALAKLDEIVHQVEINVQIAKRDHPEGVLVDGKRIDVLPHSQETLAGHVKDRTEELRTILSALSPEPAEPVRWPTGFFQLTGDARLRECATEGCHQHVSVRIERGGVGSDHCTPCASKIATLTHPKEAAEPGEATAYAERLARALHAKHYADNVEWKPLSGDLIGLLTQIDNMTAGLSRTAEPGDGHAKPTDHASTSPGPVNCSIRKRHQGEDTPRTCERCTLGPCPFFHEDGSAKR